MYEKHKPEHYVLLRLHVHNDKLEEACLHDDKDVRVKSYESLVASLAYDTWWWGVVVEMKHGGK